MGYKNIEDRRKHYQENKDKINAKRREHRKNPEVNKRLNEQNLKWRHDNIERAREITNRAKKKYDEKCKEEVFNHYGNKCACCGESNPAFLTIDHIDGGGTQHRKKIKEKITVWLYKNNFPTGYQTLCFNCNWGKYFNGGICPHKEESKS